MKDRFQLVEEQFRIAARRERTRSFLRRSALLGAVISVGFLALDAALVTGVVTDIRIARGCQIVLWIGAAIAWLVIGLTALGEVPGRRDLAAALEKGNPELQDRLHTVVHLEKNRGLPAARAFRERIGRQTQAIVTGHPLAIPLPLQGLLLPAAAFAVLLLATLWYHDRFRPWERLQARVAAAESAAKEQAPPPPPDFASPTNDLAEVLEPWGEVRITEPGRDTVITTADTLRLQVEAAANQPLTELALRSAVNGGEVQNRTLPRGTEPRYAVHQTNLSAAELDLKPWDVMTYHGRAGTEDGRGFESDVYFLEVHPLREDLQRLQAGNGECYNLLSELTTLIQQQQELIRQTHRHITRPHPGEELQEQDRLKLANVQHDVGEAVDHLSARIAGRFPEAPTAPVLIRLDVASLVMERAGQQLRTNAAEAAQGAERTALGHLSAAREEFHRALVANPDAFRPSEELTGLEGHLRERLQEMAEYRDELKAARELVRRTEEEQRRIAAQASRPGTRTNLLQLAEQERSLERSLGDFQEKHPLAFRRTEEAADAARDSLRSAAESMEKRSPQAAGPARNAQEKVGELRQALDQRAEQQRLAEAYELRRLLEEQARGLGECQNPGAGAGGGTRNNTAATPAAGNDAPNGGPTPGGIQRLVQNTKSTLRQLGRIVNDNPEDRHFSDALRKTLSPVEQAEVARQLEDVAGMQNPADRSQAAGRAREGVEQVVRAFDEGLPPALQAARKNDALQPGPSEGIERARRQLEDLRERLGNQDGESTPRDQQLWRDALLNLGYSLSSKGDGNESTAAIALLVVDELKNADPVDLVRLGELLGELTRAAAEPPPGVDAESEKAAASNIDPQRLPAAYRKRIEEYFRKLSEAR